MQDNICFSHTFMVDSQLTSHRLYCDFKCTGDAYFQIIIDNMILEDIFAPIFVPAQRY